MDAMTLDWGRLRLRERPGRGPLVVLLHGTGVDGDCWRQTIAELPATAHCLALDYRCHGESDTPTKDFTFADLAADLRAVLAARGWPPCLLVGHSLGGMLASAVAAELPGCQGLVLVEGWVCNPAWSAFAPDRYMAGLPDDLRIRLTAQTEATRARVPKARWDAFWRTVTAVDNSAALAAWQGPVIHQYGDAGRLPGTEAALRVPRTAGCRLEWVPAIGHFAPWLRPDTIARACVELGAGK